MNRDLNRLAKRLERQGFECKETADNHLQVRKSGAFVAVFAGTPSDSRSWKNSLADLKRAGYDLNWKK